MYCKPFGPRPEPLKWVWLEKCISQAGTNFCRFFNFKKNHFFWDNKWICELSYSLLQILSTKEKKSAVTLIADLGILNKKNHAYFVVDIRLKKWVSVNNEHIYCLQLNNNINWWDCNSKRSNLLIKCLEFLLALKSLRIIKAMKQTNEGLRAEMFGS